MSTNKEKTKFALELTLKELVEVDDTILSVEIVTYMETISLERINDVARDFLERLSKYLESNGIKKIGVRNSS